MQTPGENPLITFFRQSVTDEITSKRAVNYTEAVHHVILMYPERAQKIIEMVGYWPSSDPILYLFQKEMKGRARR